MIQSPRERVWALRTKIIFLHMEELRARLANDDDQALADEAIVNAWVEGQAIGIGNIDAKEQEYRERDLQMFSDAVAARGGSGRTLESVVQSKRCSH